MLNQRDTGDRPLIPAQFLARAGLLFAPVEQDLGDSLVIEVVQVEHLPCGVSVGNRRQCEYRETHVQGSLLFGGKDAGGQIAVATVADDGDDDGILDLGR